MQYYNHILACLDLSGIDTWIIRYAAFMANMVKADKLTFIHVIQAYDIPENQRHSPQIVWKLERHINWKIREHIRNFDFSETKVKVEVKKENRDASQVILDYIRNHDVDVTTLGKKADEDRKEMYSGRIMALGESDMLLVPLSPHHRISHVLAALDFSKLSNKAFRIARQIALHTNSGLACHMLFSMPHVYFPLTPRQSIARYIENKGKKRMEQFLAHQDIEREKVSCYTDVTDYKKQGERVMENAHATDAQLVVVGARGRTSSPSTLLGFVAEQVRKYKSPVPVLVVKNPIEKNSFWNMFFGG